MGTDDGAEEDHMNWRKVTLFVMGFAAAALIAWDIVVASNNVPRDTISEISLEFVRKYPLAAFATWFWLGIIFGHLFWPQRPKDNQ